MVPSATNTLRYHGLSQNHTNEQSGFKAEIGFIPESKLISVETHTETMNLPSTNQTTKMSKGHRRYALMIQKHNRLHLQPLTNITLDKW